MYCFFTEYTLKINNTENILLQFDNIFLQLGGRANVGFSPTKSVDFPTDQVNVSELSDHNHLIILIYSYYYICCCLLITKMPSNIF